MADTPAHGARLVLRDVEVRYDGVPVVAAASLHVNPGEIVALLGTNGAGKSTLVDAVAGVIRSRTGSVRLDGDELIGLRADQIATLGLGVRARAAPRSSRR